MNELMQMRLRSGGTEGLLAEKLEVSFCMLQVEMFIIALLSINIAAAQHSRARTPQKRPRELRLFHLQTRRLQGNLVAASQYLKWPTGQLEKLLL